MNVLRSIALTCLLFLFASVAFAADKPNIVMILGDDQGFGDYGFMGHREIKTPRLDRLAAEGLTFTQGYVPSSLCRPSLATMITGLFAHQHKITSNDPPLPKGAEKKESKGNATFLAQRQEMINYIDKSPTLPRTLAEHGYLSFQSGKWWEGNHKRGGFTNGMTHGDPKRNGRHGDEGLKIGRETMQPVFDFIDLAQQERKPFFLWYAPMLPHSPHNPPERFLAKYRDQAPTLEIAKYWAMCEWWDETVGQLLDYLDTKKLSDNTLVVFICDNGWIQDPNADKYAPRSKQSPYDTGLRTPIVLRWPGHISPRRSQALASTIDLAPTILAAAGLKKTSDMPGINLADEQQVAARHTLYGECFEHNAVDIHSPASSLKYRWIRDGQWKLILPAPTYTQDKSGPQLFDLSKDPTEEHNLAADHKDQVALLTQKLDAWWPGK